MDGEEIRKQVDSIIEGGTARITRGSRAAVEVKIKEKDGEEGDSAGARGNTRGVGEGPGLVDKGLWQ